MKIRRRFNRVERNDLLEKSQRCLWEDDGKIGREYLFTQRKISESVARSFGLGFIPSDVRHQLAGRIIFPIYDPSGNLVALSSKLVDESIDLLPGYWHEGYEKSYYLFGIQNAIQALRRWGFAVLVEGQFDVLQLHTHNITSAVGLCSTLLSEVQNSVISRYCDEIVLILDKDENKAGQTGVKKAMDRYRHRNDSFCYRKKITSVDFTENIDPDEFVKKYGSAPLKQLIKAEIVKMRTSYARQC